jgi:hypothetical protein
MWWDFAAPVNLHVCVRKKCAPTPTHTISSMGREKSRRVCCTFSVQ